MTVFLFVVVGVVVSSLKLCLILVTPWAVAHQASLSVGFSRQEYWSGLLCSPPRDFADPEMELLSPVSLALQETTDSPRKQG